MSQCVFLFDGSQYNQQDCCPRSGRANIELSLFFLSDEPNTILELIFLAIISVYFSLFYLPFICLSQAVF